MKELFDIKLDNDLPMLDSGFYNWLTRFALTSGNFNGKFYFVYNCRPIAKIRYLEYLGFCKEKHFLNSDDIKSLDCIFDYHYNLNYDLSNTFGSLQSIRLYEHGILNIRQVYRLYLKQCRTYSFSPLSFKLWYNQNTSYKR